MAREEKNRWAGIVIGPVLVFLSLVALWKNETRFDYFRAAEGTQEIATLGEALSGQLISFTDDMDRGLSLPGEYVESFTGYLVVWRQAEIYAWDKDTSDDHTTWNLEWMSSVERNSRNSGITQQLSSNRFTPATYTICALAVDCALIEFVDASQSLDFSKLSVKRERVVEENSHFYLRKGASVYLRKGASDNLGDERISYSGILVPDTATYFGKWDSQKGVADTTHQRTGFVNQIIQDSGILHHVVAGDRDTALATMKSHIVRLRWIVRLIGTVCVVFGFYSLFATIVGVLFHLPIIGHIAQTGAFLLALVIALPLALFTIAIGYSVAHPLVLVLLIAAFVAVSWVLWRRGKSSQQALKNSLDNQYGHTLNAYETKELEFLELAQLAMSDANFCDQEKDFLRHWARKHR